MSETKRLKPAVIGGLIVAVLSLVPYVSIGFILWALLGGAIAAKLLVNKSPTRLTAKDGARIGIFAGLIGGGIYLLVAAPMTAFQLSNILDSLINAPQSTPQTRALFQSVQQSTMLKILVASVTVFVVSLIMAGLTTLGGILGVAIFEKRKPEPEIAPVEAEVAREEETVV